VLKAIVAELRRQVRSSDLIGRLGGDEFALLLWNLSETDAHAKAAALEQAVDGLAFRFRAATSRPAFPPALRSLTPTRCRPRAGTGR